MKLGLNKLISMGIEIINIYFLGLLNYIDGMSESSKMFETLQTFDIKNFLNDFVQLDGR